VWVRNREERRREKREKKREEGERERNSNWGIKGESKVERGIKKQTGSSTIYM